MYKLLVFQYYHGTIAIRTMWGEEKEEEEEEKEKEEEEEEEEEEDDNKKNFDSQK